MHSSYSAEAVLKHISNMKELSTNPFTSAYFFFFFVDALWLSHCQQEVKYSYCIQT